MMYKRIIISSLFVGMFCFDGVFSSDTPLKDSVNSGSEFKQPKNEPVSTDKSRPTETESFYADGGVPVDLAVQSKEQPKNTESNTNTDAKRSSDSEDEESCMSFDLISNVSFCHQLEHSSDEKVESTTNNSKSTDPDKENIMPQ